jgi:hypothetical protein
MSFLIGSSLLGFPGGKIFFTPGDDSGFQTGLIKRSFPEVLGHPFRAVEEDEKDLSASGAAELKSLSSDSFGNLGPAQGKAAEMAALGDFRGMRKGGGDGP